MKVFLAVILDLLDFVKELLWPNNASINTETVYLPPPTKQPLLQKAPQAVESEVSSPSPLLAFTEGYICVPSARVFIRPVWVMDSFIALLPLGKAVSVLSFEGRFVRIQSGEVEGWVLKDEVVQEKAAVWPMFIPGEVYEAKHAEVIKLRALIADEFFTSELYLPLQPMEYVSYRLRESGRSIAWPHTRPRPAGLWHELLKGQPGIFISLEPKTSAVIEYLEKDDLWCLGYVEAVMVDGSITITTVGRKEEGGYEKLTLLKPNWQLLRPVFIQIA